MHLTGRVKQRVADWNARYVEEETLVRSQGYP